MKSYDGLVDGVDLLLDDDDDESSLVPHVTRRVDGLR